MNISGSDTRGTTSGPKLSCLVCAACDASVCQSSDIIGFPIPPGRLSSSTVFSYELEDLLDLPVGVWCYSCTEHVESSITLVEGEALQPSPWIGTEDAIRQLQANNGSDAIVAATSSSNTNSSSHGTTAASSGVSTTTTRSEATSKRVDLIRVRDALVNGSLVLVPPTSPPTNAEERGRSDEDDVESMGDVMMPPITRSSSTVGTEEVHFEETHAIFHQTRSHESWFRGFTSHGKLYCAACEEHLGWMFAPATATIATATTDDEEGGSNVMSRSNDIHQSSAAANNSESRNNWEDANPSHPSLPPSDNIDDTAQTPFCGLLLKKMKQREWDLADILRPLYASTVRRAAALAASTTIPLGASPHGGVGATDATLLDLTLRVQSLRQQTMLYIDLLTKHKEQGDVQRQLLQSQKDRIGAHEEKILTLQQIADAQRQQLDMQQRHLKYQEDLLRNQREQIGTQQQQIEVEQMLLGEQNRTIHTQLEQMKVMQAHLRAKDERLRLEMEVRRLQERRMAPVVVTPPESITAATDECIDTSNAQNTTIVE